MAGKQISDVTCPSCGFTGKFTEARPRFLVFDLWHWLVERNLARRSWCCPECGMTLTSPKGRWVPYFIVLMIVVVAVVGAIIASEIVK